ncbi:recombinase RecT [Nitratireductor basaltis]|uniref:Uncharacterized protein n=1 Tax=Nitratireductor basaltis TaxID=472175 RepID=A0A084UBN9_9HYPH|nr:recombinase RecT [Nitratireductor basaltis]KFB10375.1 hypothetical protein EL18_01406 [Nitratireductor basaltis]
MNQIATSTQRELAEKDKFRQQMKGQSEAFCEALIGSNIPPEKFQRVVATAVMTDTNILFADRKSLMEATMRAAQDGLLPDKREGAFVLFKNRVQWMPMIGGIIKKIHQSGDISLITAKVVYGGDTYRTWVDDEGEHVLYEPAEEPDHNVIRQVFAMAKTKDGTLYVEALTTRDIEKIRSVSRSGEKGPWKDWWEEMAKKSAIRRLAKRLPLSSDIHDLIQRDNEMYDLSRAPEPRQSVMARFRASATPQIEMDRGEGFDIDHITRETGTLTSEDAEQVSSASPSLADEGDGADPAPETPSTVATESEPAEAADQAEEASTEQASTPEASHGDEAGASSAVNPQTYAAMTECIDRLLGAATDTSGGDVEKRKEKVEKFAAAWCNELPDHTAFVDKCKDTALRIAEKPAERAKAEEYLKAKLPEVEA